MSKSFKNPLRAVTGFTLIELMITIAILGTLTALTAQAISQALKAKVKLQDQIDDVSRMRDAMRLLERDLNLSFHYRDIEKDLYDPNEKKTRRSRPLQPRPFRSAPRVPSAEVHLKALPPHFHRTIPLRRIANLSAKIQSRISWALVIR